MNRIKNNRQTAIVLSCEHGGNQVPEKYSAVFTGAREVLCSHRGWDPGALSLLKELAKVGVDFIHYSENTRLLIDLNRSLHRRSLFSEFTKTMTASEKEQIIKQYYQPFRERFSAAVSRLLDMYSFVFHISVHSFTPVLSGEVRNADVGLLYDPGFGKEKELAMIWRDFLHDRLPEMKVRLNYPYSGKPDGHVFASRQKFGPEKYAGLELEINQKYAFQTDFNQLMREAFGDFLMTIIV